MPPATNALFIIMAAQIAQRACDEEMKKRKERGEEEVTTGDIICMLVLLVAFIGGLIAVYA